MQAVALGGDAMVGIYRKKSSGHERNQRGCCECESCCS